MKNISKNLFIALLIYFIVLQPMTSTICAKYDYDCTETVLLIVLKKNVGEYNLGVFSKYKYVYVVQVLKRDGWIGYIDKIYSNQKLIENKKYGLEIRPVESSSWLEYFCIPSIWTNYSFDILSIYNNNKNIKIDFEKEKDEVIYKKMEEY